MEAARQRGGELVQRPAQVGPSSRCGQILPEQIRQMLAGERLPLSDQVTEQSQRLARLKAGHRLTLSLHLGRAQEP